MNLIHEIHRRSLWQVLGFYLAASWIVLQVIDVLTNNFGLPDWVPAFALVLLLIGLPIVLGTAFVQEGIRGGVRETTSGGDADPASDRAPAASLESQLESAEPDEAPLAPAQTAAIRFLTTISSGDAIKLTLPNTGSPTTRVTN